MKVYIILILTIIVVLLIYNSRNEHFLDITNLDKLQDCTDSTNNIVFNTVNANNLSVDGKKLNEYLLNVSYPIGSFYVQFPDVSNNQVSKAFPDEFAPSNLFGGKWDLMWEKDAVFFRTQGTLSDDSRDTNGIQPYAMLDLSGYTSSTQMDYNNKNILKGEGVFKSGTNFYKVGTDSGTSSGKKGSRNYFDLSAVALTGSELRVRNRIIRIWKRVG